MNLVFEVLNAITGKGDRPATHNMPRDCRHLLIHMANRAGKDRIFRFGLALLSSDADIGLVTMRRCIGELLERGWLRDAGWSGPRNNAVRCFLVCTEGGAWAVSTAMHRLSPPQRRAIAAAQSASSPDDETADAPSPSGDDPPVHETNDRPVIDPSLAPSPGDNYPPDHPPGYPPRSPTQDPGADRSGSDDMPLFGGSGGAGTTTQEQRGRRRRAPKDKAAPTVRAEDRYADAYERAHRDAGFPITPLTASEKKLLGPIAATHARYRDDTPITGDELVRWFYQRGRAFRRDVTDMSRHRGGARPYGFGCWFDNGADGEERPLAPGQEDEPPPSDEPVRDEQEVPEEWRPTAADVGRELDGLKRRFGKREAAHG